MKPLPNGSAGPFVARSPWFGAIAQLGERLHGMQEVSGSIPLGSTNFLTSQDQAYTTAGKFARRCFAAPQRPRRAEPIGPANAAPLVEAEVASALAAVP